MSSEWIETSNGNRISKKATIKGSHRILISGMCVIDPECTVDGHVRVLEQNSSTISMGRFCLIGKGAVLRPPVIGYKTDKTTGKKVPVHAPLAMNSYTIVKAGGQIHCKQIGSRVVIGCNAKLGRCSNIGDVVIVDDGVVVPENCQIPSFTRVRKNQEWNDSITLEPLNGSFKSIIESWCKEQYLGISVKVDDWFEDP